MHVWGWLASGFLVLVAITLASHTINEHLHHYCTPEIQRHKVRVIAYPAAYSILAWLSYLKYDYETVILFFARLCESFAVYNLYMCLQSYLQPYRTQNEGVKESVSTTVFGIPLKIKSKWGLHFRVIIDILVFQFPIWNILSALISIITQIKGVYCDGVFSSQGAYVYLTAIQFISLSIILMALFSYLSVFDSEWKEGDIKAHQMFWCVKAPIMVIFYFGDILLAVLTYFEVIQDIPYSTTSGTYWTAAAIKNGYYVLLICATMAVVSLLMQLYFGVSDADYEQGEPEHHYFEALWDGFLAYIPQFILSVFMCGGDTVTLAKKRIKLKHKERRLSEDERSLLTPAETEAAEMPHSVHDYLTQPMPSLQNNKLYGEDRIHNFNALPLEPLNSKLEASPAYHRHDTPGASDVPIIIPPPKSSNTTQP
ncbi:organic solute transporter Ostalpha-domain-containing protein [Blakeslea trispora]|nr:organic solute transporter Ostalpha-domain-containing protein [Blakeslea trispora]